MRVILYRIIFFGVIFIVILSQISLSQSYTKLFTDYLPANYLSGKKTAEQAEINLSRFAKINPDLIYFYIQYLVSISEKKCFNKDSNYYNILHNELSKSNKINNDWFKYQIDIAERLSESALVKQAVISLIDDFIIDESELRIKPLELPIDKNLQKFFSYKSLTKDTSLIFNDNVDYSSLFESIIQEMKAQFIMDYNRYLVDRNYNKVMNADSILQNYFFVSGFSNDSNKLNEINFGEYLISEINYPDFKEKSGIGIGVNYQSLGYTFPKQDFDEENLPFYKYSIDESENSIDLVNISASYKFNLDEFKSSFSNIKLSLNYSVANKSKKLSNQKNDLNKFIFIWEGEPSNFTQMFYGIIKSVSWEIESKAFSSELSIPVYYFSRNVFFEVGINYTYLNAKYLIVVDKEIEDQTSLDPNVLAHNQENYSFTSAYNLFNATASVNILIENIINFRALINSSLSFQVGVEYFFNIN